MFSSPITGLALWRFQDLELRKDQHRWMDGGGQRAGGPTAAAAIPPCSESLAHLSSS